MKYGKLLESFPLSFHFGEDTDLSEVLEKFRLNVKPSQLDDWLANNIGPLPAVNYPRRVKDVIVSGL